MGWGVTPTRHWGTPTRARGSPSKLLRADGTARSHEAVSARKAPSCALLAARHTTLSPRHESLPARHESLPRHDSSPARHESLPAQRAALPAQQLVLPARRAQPGFNSTSAGARVWGSGGVRGALQARQHAAAGGQRVRAWPLADWQDRLGVRPSREPKQTGGSTAGCVEEVDKAWSRYLDCAKGKLDKQAGSATSGTVVVSSSQVHVF